MGEDEPLWDELRRLTDLALARADDVTVVVVANTKVATPSGSGDRTTEYLSDEEAAQLLDGLRERGFRTRFHGGEAEFISAALSDPSLGTTSPHVLVYNLAQSGQGPGRKSLVPSFCDLRSLPTCNSDAYAVSLARNKLHVQAILERFGIPVPGTWAYSARGGWLLGRSPPSGVGLIAKAAHESASIGLDHDSVGALDPAYEAMLARKSETLRQPMVVQTLIEGREVEAPVVRVGATSGVLGPAMVTLGGSDMLGARVLDYDAVAADDYGYAAPGDDQGAIVDAVRRAAASACDVLGLRGFARVDFRVTLEGAAFVIDVATSPHLVRHSAYAHVFREAGWRHEDMLACMVAVNASRLGWI